MCICASEIWNIIIIIIIIMLLIVVVGMNP